MNPLIPCLVAVLSAALAASASSQEDPFQLGEQQSFLDKAHFTKSDSTPTFAFTHADQGRLVTDMLTAGEVDKACRKCVKVMVTVAPPLMYRYFDSLATYNKFLAEDCAQSVSAGRRKRVDTDLSQLCKTRWLIDVRQSGRVAYDIWRGKNGVNIGMSIRFMTSDELATPRAQKMFYDIFIKCPDRIAEVLRRYGITMATEVIMTRSPSDSPVKTSHPEIQVDLNDTFGRSNTGEFYFRGQSSWMQCLLCRIKREPCPDNCKEDVSDEFCATMAHEMGHFLGLEDEYADEKCPDRPFISKETDPYSLMADPFEPWSQVGLYPRHIGDLVRPLCRGTSAVVDGFPPVYRVYSVKE